MQPNLDPAQQTLEGINIGLFEKNASAINVNIRPFTLDIKYLDKKQALSPIETVVLNYASGADMNRGSVQAHPNRSGPGAGIHEGQSTLAGTTNTPYKAYHEFQVQQPISKSHSVDTPIKAIVACNQCSVKKRKCDEQRPRCSRCQKGGKPCIYGKNGRMEKARSISQMEREIKKLKREMEQLKKQSKKQCKVLPDVSIMNNSLSIMNNSPCLMTYSDNQAEVTKRTNNQPESDAVFNHVGTGSNPWIVNLDLSKKQIVMKFYNTQQLCEIHAYCEGLLRVPLGLASPRGSRDQVSRI